MWKQGPHRIGKVFTGIEWPIFNITKMPCFADLKRAYCRI